MEFFEFEPSFLSAPMALVVTSVPVETTNNQSINPPFSQYIYLRAVQKAQFIGRGSFSPSKGTGFSNQGERLIHVMVRKVCVTLHKVKFHHYLEFVTYLKTTTGRLNHLASGGQLLLLGRNQTEIIFKVTRASHRIQNKGQLIQFYQINPFTKIESDLLTNPVYTLES